MNINELKQALNDNNISPEVYYIDMQCPILDQGYCLNYENNQWVVYFQERGRKRYKKKTTNESEACEFMLKWILDGASNRIGAPSSVPPPQ